MSNAVDVGGGRGVAANAAWLMVAELVGKVSNFALVVILARGLGPREYGHFAFALAFLPLFLQLARWGIDITALRNVAARFDRFSAVIVNAAVIRVGLATAATAVGLLLVPLFVSDGAALEVVIVVGLALLLDELTIFLSVGFTAMEQMHLHAAVLITNRVLSTALAGVVVASGGGLVAIGTAYLLGSLGGVVVSTAFFARRLPRVHLADVDRSEMGALLREGAPLGIASFLNMAVFRLDTVLLRVIQGPVAVGIYGVAYRFFEPLLFVTWNISHAATTRLVRESEQGEQTRTFELAMAAILAFYLPIAAGAPLVVDWVLDTLFGQEYAAADQAVLWLAASGVPYAVAHLARTAIIAGGERRSVLGIAIVVLVANVSLNVALIPDHGVAGAAVATFAAEALNAVLLLVVYAKRVRPVRVTGALLVPLLASAAMAAVLWLTARGAAALVVGPLVYGAMLALSAHLLAPGDLTSLRQLLRPRDRL